MRQRLWAGGELILYAEGGTSRTLDPAVGDLSGTNGLAQPDDLYLGRLFLLQDLVAPWAGLAVGKLDLSDFFDTNAVANCEVNRFLAGSLVNDPVIPFPQRPWQGRPGGSTTSWRRAWACWTPAAATRR